MGKIKIKTNKNVIEMDFKANPLNNNLLFDICNLFDLENIYIDIFGVNGRKYNFSDKLLERKASVIVLKINSNDLTIKATVKEIPMIIEVLTEFDFDDLNIWDCYTDLEQYIKDKKPCKIPLFKPVELKIDSKFYLNFSPIEGQKVEIICDLSYDKQGLFEKITALVK